MPERARTFKSCARVLLQIHNAGTDQEEIKGLVGPVVEARKCTLSIIAEIAAACEDGTEAAITKHVENVLSDLHPEVRYKINEQIMGEKLIRDLAQIAASFRSIELGVERSNREWFLEAKIFCDHMADELNQLPL